MGNFKSIIGTSIYGKHLRWPKKKGLAFRYVCVLTLYQTISTHKIINDDNNNYGNYRIAGKFGWGKFGELSL